MQENVGLVHQNSVAARIAERALARRGEASASEVRRLLDAALDVMRGLGTTARPRVADIVAAAGLSNEAFYRHFPSKDALVAALLEDGAEQLASYVSHAMAKEAAPEGKVRRLVETVLSLAGNEDVAAATLALLWNANSLGKGFMSGPSAASGPLADLLVEPLKALGSPEPELHALLGAHAVVGVLSDHLWRQERPSRAATDVVTAFCVNGSRATG